jgi:hypothetical protein
VGTNIQSVRLRDTPARLPGDFGSSRVAIPCKGGGPHAAVVTALVAYLLFSVGLIALTYTATRLVRVRSEHHRHSRPSCQAARTWTIHSPDMLANSTTDTRASMQLVILPC